MTPCSALVTIANDDVFDQALAFLESVRINSSGIKLFLIPYNEKCEKVARLQQYYDFVFYPIKNSERLSALSTFLFGHSQNKLVKLNAFNLPLRSFFLLDIDIIVLEDLNYVVTTSLPSSESHLIYMDASPMQSYKPDVDERFNGRREFNSGTFISSNQFLNSDIICRVVEENIDLFRSVAVSSNQDQPMLNFVMDMLGLKSKNFDEVGIEFSSETWFLKDVIVPSGPHRFINKTTGKVVPLIHYAGYSSRGLQNAPRFADLYLYYLQSGCHHIGVKVDEVMNSA